MDRIETACDDSLTRGGGEIPHSGGVAAFTLRKRRPLPIPVLIAVPHAGRHYPAELLARLRHPAEASMRLEDRYVDLVADAVARETGAALLKAQAPRAMIDLNRAPDDVDWDMVRGKDRTIGARLAAGRRSRSGLGLVPRRLPGLGELWNSHLTQGELKARIDGVHLPYHFTLAKTLEAMRDRWGAALLIDLHSMPPLGPKKGRERGADFVIGDRFGASCEARIAMTALDHFDTAARPCAHNRPYAGGYVLDTHGSPARRINAIQLEICRAIYLDEEMREPGSGLAETAALVVGLVRRLADELCGGAGDVAQSAE